MFRARCKWLNAPITVFLLVLIVFWNNICINPYLSQKEKFPVLSCGMGTELVGSVCLPGSKDHGYTRCGVGTKKINDVCEIVLTSNSSKYAQVFQNTAHGNKRTTPTTDSSSFKLWNLDSSDVSILMSSDDVVGEDHVTETLMHIIHLKRLVDGVKSGTACQGNKKIATNGGLPLFILDVGANVGVFSWHAIRGLLPPVSRWAGNHKIGTTELGGALFHSAYSLDVHMVEPVDSNRKIIQNWAESMVENFNLGPTVHSTTPTKSMCRLPDSDIDPAFDIRPAVYLPNSGRWVVKPELRLHLHEAAASDVEGHANFHRTAMRNGEGGEETGGLDIDGERVGKTSVPLTTVDALWDIFGSARGFQHIFILKIDVEGHEVNVFQGMRDVLKKRIAELIIFECKKRDQLRFISPLLAENGYDLFFLTRHGLRAIHVELDDVSIHNLDVVEKWPEKWMNLLAIKKNLGWKDHILRHLHPSNFQTIQSSVKGYKLDYAALNCASCKSKVNYTLHTYYSGT
jgi:FkbM family methyltransferase